MKNAILIFTVFALAGCVTTTDRFRIVSTKASTGAPVNGGSKVHGESCKKSILFIPYERDGSLEDAVDNALEKSNSANALVDLKVKKESLMTVFYNYRCIEVDGTPVQIGSK